MRSLTRPTGSCRAWSRKLCVAMESCGSRSLRSLVGSKLPLTACSWTSPGGASSEPRHAKEALMLLRIEPDGQVYCLYGESIDLAALGDLTIKRASHVEPDDAGQWWA